MINVRINRRKFDRMALLSMQNGIRLHGDSILLFENERFPSAYALSILAMEEVGKSFLLQEVVYQDDRHEYDSKEIQELLEPLYLHRVKQGWFARMVTPMRSRFPFPQWWKDMSNGKMDLKKQNAIYVGLPRNGRRIDERGRINRPSRITRRQAENSVTMVNDYLLEEAAFTVKGQNLLTPDEMYGVFTHDFIKQLREAWPTMKPTAKRNFERAMSWPDPPPG